MVFVSSGNSCKIDADAMVLGTASSIIVALLFILTGLVLINIDSMVQHSDCFIAAGLGLEITGVAFIVATFIFLIYWIVKKMS